MYNIYKLHPPELTQKHPSSGILNRSEFCFSANPQYHSDMQSFWETNSPLDKPFDKWDYLPQGTFSQASLHIH